MNVNAYHYAIQLRHVNALTALYNARPDINKLKQKKKIFKSIKIQEAPLSLRGQRSHCRNIKVEPQNFCELL